MAFYATFVPPQSTNSKIWGILSQIVAGSAANYNTEYRYPTCRYLQPLFYLNTDTKVVTILYLWYQQLNPHLNLQYEVVRGGLR